MRLPPAEIERLRAAVVAFCERSGNARRLARVVRLHEATISKFACGGCGVSPKSAASIYAALASLPYVPPATESSGRRTPTDAERLAVTQRMTLARQTYSRDDIRNAGATKTDAFYSIPSQCYRMGRESVDRLNAVLDTLDIPRVEAAHPPVVVAMPDAAATWAPLPDADAETIRAELRERDVYRAGLVRVAAKCDVPMHRLRAITRRGSALSLAEAESIRAAIAVVPAGDKNAEAIEANAATVRRIEAYRARRGHGAGAELARASGVTHQRICNALAGSYRFPAHAIESVNRALDTLESQTTSTTGATR